MSVKYYNPDDNFPPIVESIINRLFIYLSILLYTKENITDAQKRLIRADIINNEDDAFPKNMLKTGESNLLIPFTAWNLGELLPRENMKNHFAKSGYFYSDQIGAYTFMLPMSFDFHTYSFFDRTDDYLRARSLISQESLSLKRLRIPCKINGVDTYFSVNLHFDTSKGKYAQAFETWLTHGKLNDISCKIRVDYWDLILNVQTKIADNGDISRELIEIYPIETMQLILTRDQTLSPIESIILNKNTGVIS